MENEDPDAFGAGTIVFKLRESMEKLESNKDSYKNFQEGEDRVIGGITFKCRTYEYIRLRLIEYVAQIDDGRFLSVWPDRSGLRAGNDARYHSQQHEVPVTEPFSRGRSIFSVA